MSAPAATAAKLASSASPSRPDFSGWNCVANTLPRRTAAMSGAAVVARGHDVGRVVGHAVERVHEVHPRPIAEPVEQRARSGARRSQPVPLHLRSLHAGRDPHDPAREHAEPADGGVLVRRLEEHLHADADAEERPAGRPTAARATSSSPAPRSASMQRPKAPTPGSTTAAAALGDEPGVGGEAGVGTDVDERLLGRAQVADAVVEHGDQRAPAATVTARPWWTARFPGALDAHGVAQAAGQTLERRLDDVVDVAAPSQGDVQRDAGGGGEAVDGVLGQLRDRTAGCRAAGTRAARTSHTTNGRPDRSSATSTSASSSGYRPLANRRTPALSPSASRKASPSAMATSSTVWWLSMCRSPSAFTVRSKPPWRPSWSSMWS